MAHEPSKPVDFECVCATNHLAGRFRYDVVTERWSWSEETYRIHGFEPHEVVPTTALILAHKHPADQEQVRRILERAMATGGPFSSMHRIMDAHGVQRMIVLVGEGRRGAVSHELRELVGFFVDVTHMTDRLADARATVAIRASAANRASIEQAKGIIGFALGTDAEGAFDWMRQASNDLNLPLRDLAHEVIERSAHAALDVSTITASLRSTRH